MSARIMWFLLYVACCFAGGNQLAAFLFADFSHTAWRAFVGMTVLAWMFLGYKALLTARHSDHTPSVWSLWTWRKRAPELNEGQPVHRYWVEQFAVILLCSERFKAHYRDDQQTVRRISAVLEGGTQWERDERRRLAFAKSAAKIAAQLQDMNDIMARSGKRAAEAMGQVDFSEFRSSSRFHNTIARERRKGMAFVRDEVNRARREEDLPEIPFLGWFD